MKRNLLIVAVMASFVFSGGCQYFKKDKKETTHAKIAAADLPSAVRKGFERDHAGAKITSAEKETYADGTVHWEIEYTDAAGKSADVEYTSDGEQLEKH